MDKIQQQGFVEVPLWKMARCWNKPTMRYFSQRQVFKGRFATKGAQMPEPGKPGCGYPQFYYRVGFTKEIGMWEECAALLLGEFREKNMSSSKRWIRSFQQ